MLRLSNPTAWARKMELQRIRRRSLTKDQRRANYEANREDILRRGREWRARNRPVMRKHKKSYAERYPEKVAEGKRRMHLRKYGITRADYERMLAEQGGVCLLCGSPPPPSRPRHPNRLAVDHCHRTGKVRALLCQLCNMGVAHVERFDGILPSVLEYIKRFK